MTIASPLTSLDFLSLPSVRALMVAGERPQLGSAARAAIEHVGIMPLPARGSTLARWRVLGALAGVDLALVKVVEPHWDAVAILEDCFPGGYAAAALATGAGEAAVWAVWAAEPPDARVLGVRKRETTLGASHVDPVPVALTGRKAWCSGAAAATHALVTYWDDDGQSCLAALRLDAPGVTVTDDGWHAVGMRASASVDVRFDDAAGVEVGAPGAYLQRPGFWHGGMGIAACWLGACVTLARAVHVALLRRSDPHALAHLGAIDAALCAAQAFVRETASWVDDHPDEDAWFAAARMRLAVESCVDVVLAHGARALGAGPLCRDAHVARIFADLPVFVRQSHAERDLAALGSALTERDALQDGDGEALWTL